MSTGLLTVAEAARRLHRSPHEVKGAAIGLGIQLRKVGKYHVMDDADFGIVQKAFEAEAQRDLAAV